ncbi:hypothetical protein H4S02_002070 [Coemansia sp. RSA 2611]|nr:hypothetical protein IWW52_004064 [Coemansia sp. RSA 2704]KAJ2390038.1 hypothetical protein H4S02_002070 [Coemansia sp. RSA 2611]KAJ2738108.1 hypothetical protein H4R23_001381 [Coemansia sp. Cherry 401B]
MKLTIPGTVVLAAAQIATGAPLIKSVIMTVGAEGPIQTGAYDVASVGASFAVEHTGLFGPLLNNIPGAQAILGAAQLLGGKFAGSTAGGLASRAVGGFIEGSAGNDLPLIGWLIRDQESQMPTDEAE